MYPISLDVRGRRALVAGGGAVATRKVRGLIEAGAAVCVIAPAATPELEALAREGRLEWHARPYATGDLAGARLAFAATGVPGVDAAVVAEAREKGILVDDASGGSGDFHSPAVYRTGALTFAVETGGSSPSFARRIVRELGERFDDRYARAAAALGIVRAYVKTAVPSTLRAAVMERFANREVAALAELNTGIVENEVDEIVAELERGEHPAGTAPQHLVAATRASALAMWQTRHVMACFARAGIASTLLQISTKGDRVTDRSLAAIGTDGVFVKELERALRERRADYAVHSCKDLPSTLPDDMRIAAIGPRADPRDAFCSERYPTFEALPPGAVVGTSSPRRRAQLAALRPDLRFEIIRGNVDTRLRKMRDGEYDAIVLALAGLQRLGLSATFTEPISAAVVVPAVAQGALAIETRAGDEALARTIHALFSDEATEYAVTAERAFLRTLRGGCQAPVGAYAIVDGDALAIEAVIAAPDGSRIVRGNARAARTDLAAAAALGESLARRLLAEGGSELLGAIEFARPEDDDLHAPLAGELLLLARTQERPSQIAPALRGMGADVIEAGDGEDAALALGTRVPSALLFPSSGSVRAVSSYLEHLRATGVRPVVATMGDASSEAARAAGFAPDVVASEPTVGAFVQSVAHRLLLERDPR